MIMVLARQAYSAKDRWQHEGLVGLWREMKPGVGYCRMVTITTSDHPDVRAAWQRGEIDRFYAPELGWPNQVTRGST